MTAAGPWSLAIVRVFIGVVLISLIGCGGSTVDTSYGRNRTRSVNGTGAFAGLLRGSGHEVRTAVRLSDELKDWADVIVRFSPLSGPPPRDEAAWYDEWLGNDPGRRLIYVPYDYDATREYWTRALEGLPKDATPRLRERIVEARNEADAHAITPTPHVPAQVKGLADPNRWFAVESGSTSLTCKTLSGPWAEGVEASRAGLTRHDTLKAEFAQVLLEGDGKPLVITRERDQGNQILIVASGTFLLNLPLVEPARWPLARRTVGWVGGDEDGETRPKKVAFVEGSYVLFDRASAPSVFALLNVSPFGRVAAQLLALGLAACLARAPRLGRPRPVESSGADRPVAHPEALGALLARTRQAREARSILDAYRRWRHVAQTARHEHPRPNRETGLDQ